MKHRHYDLICLVSNDLNTDRRIIRTCNALFDKGWKVLLLGRKLKTSLQLTHQNFDQERVVCRNNHGPFFYLELLFQFRKKLKHNSFDRILFVDLDTVGTSFLIRKRKALFYMDLHEYFENTPELYNKPIKKFIWAMIGIFSKHRMDRIYTVNESLANIFSKKYNRSVNAIMNVPEYLPFKKRVLSVPLETVYLGVLNPGRGLEQIVDTVKKRNDVRCTIIGGGPLENELIERADGATNIVFMGVKDPSEIHDIMSNAMIGWNLLESKSQSYYYSLANKFFDYILNGIPVITMDFPEYKKIIDEWSCGILINELTNESINDVLNTLLSNRAQWINMHQACAEMGQTYNWTIESEKLLKIYGLIK